MSNLEWGVPTQRKRKTEKFNTPVVTMARLEKSGAGRKFTFNKAAQEAFGIDAETEQSVMVGFEKGEGKNGIFIKVVNGENDLGYKLTKSATFSNKKVFEFITDLRELSNDVENELHLVESKDVAEALEVSKITTEADEVEEEMPNAEESSKELKTEAGLDNVKIENEEEAEMTEIVMSDSETQEKMEEEQSEKVAEKVEDSASEEEEETW